MSLSAGYVRATAVSILITTTFALIWGISGGLALPTIFRVVVLVLVVGVTLALVGVALRFIRAARGLPAGEAPVVSPFENRLYQIASGGQFVVIFLASRLLSAAGRSDAIIAAVVCIVGLHFFVLIPIFRSWLFGIVGGAMVVLGLASLLVAPAADGWAPRTALVGLGAALILWAGAAPLVIQTTRMLAQSANRP